MRARTLLRVAVSGLLIAAIVWRIGVGKLLGALQHVSPEWIIAAVLVAVPRLVVRAARWKTLVTAVTPVTWRVTWRSMLIGIAGGMITPSRVGALSAAFFVPHGDRVALGAMVFADLGLDLAAALTAAMPAAAHLWLGSSPWWSFAVAALVPVAVAQVPRLARYGGRSRPGGFIARVVSPLEHIGPRRLLRAYGLGLLLLGFNVVQLHLLVRSFQEVPFLAAAVACPLMLLALIFPVTVAGFGLREFASAALLARFEVPPEVAVEAALLLFVVNVGLPATAGAALLWRRRREE